MWGMAYRFQSSKYTPAQALSAVTIDGGPRLTWEENASALMDALLIEDNPAIDTSDQQRMRREASVLPTTEDSGPIDKIDLELARDRMRNGKAPGLDNINPELINRVGISWRPTSLSCTMPVSDMESSLECGRGD